MSKNDPAALQTAATDDSTELEARDRRALEQYLTVLDDTGRVAGAEDLYLVVSQSGKEYLVDAELGACECPDHEYRDVRCKHIRRVEFATGERAIPTGADVDPQLGEHVDVTPQVAATDGGMIVADDDGEILDEGDETAADERPDDCECEGFHEDADLPCWPCYREGFETPAVGAEGDA